MSNNCLGTPLNAHDGPEELIADCVHGLASPPPPRLPPSNLRVQPQLIDHLLLADRGKQLTWHLVRVEHLLEDRLDGLLAPSPKQLVLRARHAAPPPCDAPGDTGGATGGTRSTG
eukprot:15450940-Alexandrium_andersonii.AAC.2